MTLRRLASVSLLVLIIALVPASMRILRPGRQSFPQEAIDSGYERFMQTADDGARSQALELGEPLFRALLEEKPEHPALVLLTKRLDRAERIRKLVAGSAEPNQLALPEGISGLEDLGLSSPAPAEGAAPAPLLPPAREVYWTALRAFTEEPACDGLSPQQAAFCDRYYDLRMQDLAVTVGRQIVVADPNSSEKVCYAVVLPLLHLYGRDDDWGQAQSLLSLFAPAMLDVLWRFALLQAERPAAAIAIARYQVGATGEEFAPVRWVSAAADACVANRRPDLVEALVGALAAVVRDPDAAAELRFIVANSHARCADYAAAAQACRGILDDLPEASAYGKIMASYLGYLAKAQETERVIATAESARNDPRCTSHLVQILYLKWWALHKMNRQEEAAQAGQSLIEQYPENPSIAPVLLERATDALAHQDYRQCRDLLTRLTDGFPGTESARRARDILDRLGGSGAE